MPKMPESESKEETAESIAEKKEQERLKLLEAKQKEKERNEKYSKLKSKAKDDRAKYREKVLEDWKENVFFCKRYTFSTNWMHLLHQVMMRISAQMKKMPLAQRRLKRLKKIQ